MVMYKFSSAIRYLLATILVVCICSQAVVYAKDVKGEKKKEVTVKKSLKDILKEKKIDLEFERTDIRTVLKYIAKVTKTNISFYERKEKEKSKYLVTTYLKDVNALEALDVVTRIKGLSYYFQENVIWVGKSNELKDLMRLVTKAYTPRYGNVGSFKKMIEGILSEEGKMIVDKQMNLLVVTDREDVIRIIDELFKKLYG